MTNATERDRIAALDPVTVGSTGLFHAPGFLPWLRRLYRDDPAKGVRVFAEALPEVPVGLALAYLNGDTAETVEGDTVTVYPPGHAGAE